MFSVISVLLCLAGTTQQFQVGSADEVRALDLPASSGGTHNSVALAEPDRFRLTIKFRDEARARIGASGVLESSSGAQLDGVMQILASYGAKVRPAIDIPGGTGEFTARAARISGRPQPDLEAIFIIEIPAADRRRLEAAASALQRVRAVEYVYIETLGAPPPGDIAPPTPSLESQQTYFAPNPGMNVDAAWSQGVLGAGVKLSDCEYSWIFAHEDLADVAITKEPGQTPSPNTAVLGFDQHGTAVLGETSSPSNGYGCRGMVPQASICTFSEWTVEGGMRRLAAITAAVSNSAPGDVVMLEMQTVGAGGGYGPAELDPSVWLVVKAAGDAGIVVVGAAGNGNQNLDSSTYNSYMNKGDSGAILVGAGGAGTSHSKLSFSTYGSRVNLQGWGEAVCTLGYGDLAMYGGPSDKNQFYSATFGGTSSATPFVASACVAVEQRAKQVFGIPLAPMVVRQLLQLTGQPQTGGGGNIGPLPNLASALATVPLCPVVTSQPSGTTLCPGSSATLSVGAPSGCTYQWRKNGQPISNANSAAYTITNASSSTVGSFDCIVSKSGVSVGTKAAIVALQTGGIPFGTGTPGCNGTQSLTMSSCANIGNPSLAFMCDDAPENTLGVLVIANGIDLAGSDPFNIGVLTYLNFSTSTEVYAIDLPSDELGDAAAGIAVPNQPSLIGASYGAQAFWYWSHPECPLQNGGFSSSKGLRFTVGG